MRNNLPKIEELVIKILNEDVKSREDDNRLYFLVLKCLDENIVKMPLGKFLLEESNKYPAFISVERCRRKVQSIYPELQGAKERRKRGEIAYRSYSKH